MTDTTRTPVAAFPADFRGSVVDPAHPEYDAARSLYNGAFDRRPAVIARCTCAEDVVIALAVARAQGLEVAVRGGGHSMAGLSGVDGGLVVDLTAMRTVDVDPDARTATVGGGATWADYDAATQQHGLASTGGIVSHTGVGGLTLGGGMGWLVREHGLAIDNLLVVELVTADGRIRHASDEEHQDLFWAVRGGGGNFGVVTSFTFRVHPVGPGIHVGLFFWEQDRCVDALVQARELVPAMPEGTGVIVAAGLTLPPAPFVPEHLVGTVGSAVIVAGFGTAEEHATAVAPFTALPPAVEFVTSMPYVALQGLLDDTAPWGSYAYDKGLYLDALSDEAIAVIAEHVPRKSAAGSFLPMFVLDRQYARVADGATAFGGHRRDSWALAITAECETPEELAADLPWARALWADLALYASNTGGYVNFHGGDDGDARVRDSYGPDTYAKLARIKAGYDPDNVFHRNANIRPTG